MLGLLSLIIKLDLPGCQPIGEVGLCFEKKRLCSMLASASAPNYKSFSCWVARFLPKTSGYVIIYFIITVS